MDTTTVHLSLDGVHLKTVPCRQTTVSLDQLSDNGLCVARTSTDSYELKPITWQAMV